jgi:hypothetical protein
VAERRELVMREPGVERREVVDEERGGWMRGSGGERWWRRREVGAGESGIERGNGPELGMNRAVERSWLSG